MAGLVTLAFGTSPLWKLALTAIHWNSLLQHLCLAQKLNFLLSLWVMRDSHYLWIYSYLILGLHALDALTGKFLTIGRSEFYEIYYGNSSISKSMVINRNFPSRLSRARRCSENTFGVMDARFQIFRSSMFEFDTTPTVQRRSFLHAVACIICCVLKSSDEQCTPLLSSSMKKMYFQAK